MAIPKTEWIWQNGQFVKWDEATVHVTAHVLHYGSSVFEGLRSYSTPKGAAIFGLESHVRRLFDSCKIMRMDMPFAPEQVSAAITETVRRNRLESCYIRPLAYKGVGPIGLDARTAPTEMVIFALEFGRYLGADSIEQGVDVMVSSWRRAAPDTLATLSKAGGNYVSSQFIAMEAADLGFAEGIALDANGLVSEGSGENIFAMYRGVMYTPPISSSILLGVTRDCVIALAREMGYEVREQTFPREMLYVADEVFFTGTAVEISPIRSVDKVKIGNGSRGPITKRLQDEFFGIINGTIQDRHGWMTLVK
ncbi:MAG TPA: branched-chain amino acid transaminase [Anaerolineales bacterium]|nr:branched-chain amino acid transaminase [Anaerolineales bacterium]